MPLCYNIFVSSADTPSDGHYESVSPQIDMDTHEGALIAQAAFRVRTATRIHFQETFGTKDLVAQNGVFATDMFPALPPFEAQCAYIEHLNYQWAMLSQEPGGEKRLNSFHRRWAANFFCPDIENADWETINERAGDYMALKQIVEAAARTTDKSVRDIMAGYQQTFLAGAAEALQNPPSDPQDEGDE